MNQTNDELIRRILAGDEDLFHELITRHAGCVWAVCGSYISNPSDREEVAQEVFVQCYLKLHTLRNPAAFTCWLTRLTRRACLDWLRSRKRHANLMTSYEKEAGIQGDGAVDGMDSPARGDMHELVRAMMMNLPAKTREALCLCYMEGYSIPQAAEALGVSVAAVKKRLQYGRDLLRERFAAELESSLARENHASALIRSAMAVIPFGQAPWLPAYVSPASPIMKSMKIGGLVMKTRIFAVAVVVLLVIAALLCIHGVRNGWIAWGTEAGQAMVESTQSGEVITQDGMKTMDANTVALDTDTSLPERKAIPEIQESLDAAKPDKVMERGEIANPDAYASISGFVVDDTGVPIKGAKVNAVVSGFDNVLEQMKFRAQFNDAIMNRDHQYSGISNANGAFQISGIRYQGIAALCAEQEGRIGMATVRVIPEKAASDVIITVSQGVYLRGKVVGIHNEPVDNAIVFIAEFLRRSHRTPISGLDSSFLAISGDTGAFQMLLPEPGMAGLTVSCAGYPKAIFNEIEVGSDAPVILRLEPLASLTGTITWPNGSPAPGLSIKIYRESIIAEYSQEGNIIQNLYTRGGDADGVTGADGVYSITNIVPGPDYFIDVNNSEPVETMRPTESLGVIKPGEHKTWNCVLARDITIKGRVLGSPSGSPLRNVLVSAMRNGELVTGAQYLATDQEGQYTLRITSGSGEYTIAPHYLNFVVDPSELINGVNVKLNEGEERHIDLKMPSPYTLPIRVVDAFGRSLPDVDIEGNQEVNERCVKVYKSIGVTDTEGRFAWYPCNPGMRHSLCLSKEGYVEVRTPLMAGKPGETLPEQTVLMPVSTGIEGVLAVPNGSPLMDAANVSVSATWGGSDQTSVVTITDSNGRFMIPVGIPAAQVDLSFIVLDGNPGTLTHQGEVHGVVCAPGCVTDLGEIVVSPVE